MDFKTYDIFVDASINLDLKQSCSGSIVVDRSIGAIIKETYLVKDNATNNMGEAIAIFMGVRDAINLLYTSNMPFTVNIFSDSRISLFGCREWMKTWVRGQDKEGNLVGSVGVISNQEWFSAIYNDIITSGIKIKFFHVKGHVNTNSPKDLYKAQKLFKLSNKFSPVSIGMTNELLANYNNYVDEHSREILNRILDGEDINYIPNTYFIRDEFIYYYCKRNLITQYEANIHGGLNYPINFNGGM